MADILMEKTIALDFQQKETKGNSVSLTIKTCPYCHRLWKLNVNMEKGVFRCPACDESGNAAKLHAKMRNFSYKEALAELKNEDVSPQNNIKVVETKEVETASLARRNNVYCSIIKNGLCSKDQYNDLKHRGFNDEQMHWYATIQSANANVNNKVNFCCEGTKQILLEDNKFKGIPGIFGNCKKNADGTENTDWLFLAFPKQAGYLIPVITHGKHNEQMISCMQIRHFQGDTRYSFFTSAGLKNGVNVSNCNKLHYTRNFWDSTGKMNVPETVNLTEGALKADVASVLSDRCFIAVLGVNNTKDLKNELQFLKKNGCKAINVCFDMDYQDNPNVAKALAKVQKMILDAGLKIRNITWEKQYKGIDDYLLAQKLKAEKGGTL